MAEEPKKDDETSVESKKFDKYDDVFKKYKNRKDAIKEIVSQLRDEIKNKVRIKDKER